MRGTGTLRRRAGRRWGQGSRENPPTLEFLDCESQMIILEAWHSPNTDGGEKLKYRYLANNKAIRLKKAVLFPAFV